MALPHPYEQIMAYLPALLMVVVAQATAHVCLLYPHQRGSMEGLNSPGEFHLHIKIAS